MCASYLKAHPQQANTQRTVITHQRLLRYVVPVIIVLEMTRKSPEPMFLSLKPTVTIFTALLSLLFRRNTKVICWSQWGSCFQRDPLFGEKTKVDGFS